MEIIKKKMMLFENMLKMELPGQELCTKYRMRCSGCFFMVDHN